MPALDPGDLVLLTDASGVTGAHIVSALASYGFRVRVASASPDIPDLPSSVEVAPVGDWTVAGAYRAATTDVDGIVLPLGATAFAESQVRALLSTLPARLKRIVAISSTGAISTAAGTHSSDEWNTAALEVHEWNEALKGVDTQIAQLAAVTRAEHVFWDHFRERRRYDPVSLATGEPLGPGLPGELERWMRPCPEDIETPYGNVLDVRDLAAYVVRALAIEEAGGERVVLSAGPLFGNDMALAVHRFLKHPSLQRGNPDPDYRAALAERACAFECRNVLRRDMRSLDVTLADAQRAMTVGW
ncbi:NAD(P)-binding protein [Cutaneotrichosporon oleaginosum]|uniref:NAD(P)-binding protein n=1 Tax=Cutaneotrichosporon oleaginosum TaxID=879819 RepID=A0A0J0XWY4_9TREE|nr:NAD(P)-binding protein [Cutaneotrichosporon oleaginosum]KLT45561.1 NAD(P)-binding protein [Cutaneotrichosporon oleaginosum]TXT14485.1 hypothetical protein COLE_00678 [Cutaneotrichosporon oleaginosum]